MAWFEIRQKTEAKALNAVRAKILGWPEEVMRDVYEPVIRGIAEQGKETIKDVIRSSVTPTGLERAARGQGEPGRIRKGKMINAVRVEYRNRVKGFTLNVGWVRGTPGYVIFQELGTAKIHGMDSIHIAREYMLAELRKASRGRYEGQTNFELEGPGD